MSVTTPHARGEHRKGCELWWVGTDRRTIGASLGTVDTFVNLSNRLARNNLYSSSLWWVPVKLGVDWEKR